MVNMHRSTLVLTAILAVVASAQEGSPINWPLNQAVIANDIFRIKTLLVHQCTQDELDYALVATAGKGRPEAALLLLTAGATPNRKFEIAGHTSVIVAIRENKLETLKVLLEHGGDPNDTDRIGWRPLHHTVTDRYQRPDAIYALVQHGAVVDGRDGLQRTILHRAAGFGHTESVRVLLDLGANPTLREKYNQTALERADKAGYESVVKLLQTHTSKTEPEAVDQGGESTGMSFTGLQVFWTLVFFGPVFIVSHWSLRFRTTVVLAFFLIILMHLYTSYFVSDEVRRAAEYEPLYKFGQAMEDSLDRALPSDPRLKDSFLAEKLPATIGKILGKVAAAFLLAFVYWFPVAVWRRLRTSSEPIRTAS